MMIQKYVDRFFAKEQWVREQLRLKHPDGYEELVKLVVTTLVGEDDGYGNPDPETIHRIDDGDYQGTLLFVIAEKTYQPSDYWYVKVGYGSCSGCDTLQGIHDYGSEAPNDEQVEQYFHLCRDIITGMTAMQDERDYGSARVNLNYTTKDGEQVEVLEVVSWRRRNVRIKRAAGNIDWIAQEEFEPPLPNAIQDA